MTVVLITALLALGGVALGKFINRFLRSRRK